ncbi:family 2 encapsulin nanocompartment cargo protein polyprenyl transferase [Amycolatopsis suaedae]|uniref:Polyprenyl synthetase family protein n=1 Tax=Amycolatopsis suaedae TaxID=2510978 RepID=A0A4Q7JBY0_9PSEU|nr:family 2 encapsulin nanocompartment cargo protein polyprenyl transferase [Amycolatopsis suaedae]RZQ63794.1 polyprenyl synthetase family protein [Amycolatopsis suaedae]
MSIVEARETARSAAEVLAWSRTVVDPALRAAVDTLPGPMRRIAGYHLGWLDADGRAATTSGGKALRPALTLLGATAVGAGQGAVPGAVAVELAHNFSLLHDDVMDGDVTRRHRATAWAVFGTGPAILAGDALLTLALDVVAGCGHPAAHTAMRTLADAVQALVEGQITDLAFEKRSDVTVSECVGMAEAKTGALLGAACAVGGLLGGACAEQTDLLRRFGEKLGLAFQHADDLLGIWGDPAATGKPVHSDLRSRKKSLPVVAALTSGTPAGRALDELYHRADPLSESDLVRAADLVEMAGGREWSRAQAGRLLAGALRDLRAVRPGGTATVELAALARLATDRDH